MDAGLRIRQRAPSSQSTEGTHTMSESINVGNALREAGVAADAAGVLEDGTYPLIVKSAKVTNAQSGNVGLNLTLQVEAPNPSQGASMYYTLWFGGSPEGRAATFRKLIPWYGGRAERDAALSPLETLEQVAGTLVGRRLNAKVSTRENSGYVNNEMTGVQLVSKPGIPTAPVAAPAPDDPVEIVPSPAVVDDIAAQRAKLAALEAVAATEAAPVPVEADPGF